MRRIHSVLGAVCLVSMSLALLAPQALTLPEMTIEEYVALLPSDYDAIVEAEIISAEVKTLENKHGACQYMTELLVRPIRSFWGLPGIEPFVVVTNTLPVALRSDAALIERFPDAERCYRLGAAGRSDRPVPSIGERGILLVKIGEFNHGVASLFLLGKCYLPITDSQDVALSLKGDGSTQFVSYDQFAQAMDAVADRLSLERAFSSAQLIVTAELGAKREVVHGVTGSKTAVYSLTVDQTLRGDDPTTSVEIHLDLVRSYDESLEDRRLRGTIFYDKQMRRLLSHRVLVFAAMGSDGRLSPTGVGCLLIDSEERVHLPTGKRTADGWGPAGMELTEMEAMIR